MSLFDCYEARLHTLPGAPTLGMASHEQLVEHYRRLKGVNADKIVPRFGLDPDHDPDSAPDPDLEGCEFYAWGCHAMLEHEDRWQQCNLVWSWIDERPVWMSPVHWYLEVLPDPGKPSNPQAKLQRQFRLTLLGGGQLTVIERFKVWRRPGDKLEYSCPRQTLRVTADADEELRRFTGTINQTFSEMGASAVLFPPGTPQSIADRVSATFRLLTPAQLAGTSVRGPDPENFSALLDRGTQCCICNRALRDHVSTMLGIGPDCAKRFRLSHGLTAATKILQRRRELLGEAA